MARIDRTFARYASESYDAYRNDILNAGNLDPATCGIEADGRFWGTLRGKKLALTDMKALMKKDGETVGRLRGVAICATIAACALRLVAYIFKLSATPHIIVAAVAVFTIAATIGATLKLRGTIKQCAALLAQEKIHKGIAKPFSVDPDHISPEGNFSPNNLEHRKGYAKTVLETLKARAAGHAFMPG